MKPGLINLRNILLYVMVQFYASIITVAVMMHYDISEPIFKNITEVIVIGVAIFVVVIVSIIEMNNVTNNDDLLRIKYILLAAIESGMIGAMVKTNMSNRVIENLVTALAVSYTAIFFGYVLESLYTYFKGIYNTSSESKCMIFLKALIVLILPLSLCLISISVGIISFQRSIWYAIADIIIFSIVIVDMVNTGAKLSKATHVYSENNRHLESIILYFNVFAIFIYQKQN